MQKSTLPLKLGGSRVSLAMSTATVKDGSNPSGAWKGSANSRYFSVISAFG